MVFKKECVLNDRECDDCGECDICDLNPNKICDNCCVCIDKDADFNSIEIDEIIEDDSMVRELDDLEDWKYKEDYIVDYSDEDSSKETRPANRNIKTSDN
ncbi:MAG TPA: hypothetical protein VEB00_07815 [Clostridia bacterium]|nr:hypothetical protein [Clostridia bacterium]